MKKVAKATEPDINRCEMMFGWAGYTREKIAKLIKQGKVCDCDAHGGRKCKRTGKAYFH